MRTLTACTEHLLKRNTSWRNNTWRDSLESWHNFHAFLLEISAASCQAISFAINSRLPFHYPSDLKKLIFLSLSLYAIHVQTPKSYLELKSYKREQLILENRQKTKLSLLIATNENKQKNLVEATKDLIYIALNTDGVQQTEKAGTLIFPKWKL